MCDRENYEKAKKSRVILSCVCSLTHTQYKCYHPSVVALQMKDSKQSSNVGPICKDSPLIIPSFTPRGPFGRTGLRAQTSSHGGSLWSSACWRWKWSWCHTSQVLGSCISLGFSTRWLFPPTAQTDAETWNSPQRSHALTFFHRDLVLMEIKLIYESLLVTVDWNDDKIVWLCQWCPINICDDLSETFFFSIAS